MRTVNPKRQLFLEAGDKLPGSCQRESGARVILWIGTAKKEPQGN
jgi:hypothetical protein